MNILTDTRLGETGFDFGMTDLEERLGGDNGAEVRAEIAASLAAMAQVLLKARDAGLGPEDFRKAQAAHAAVTAAHDVVTRFPDRTSGKS